MVIHILLDDWQSGLNIKPELPPIPVIPYTTGFTTDFLPTLKNDASMCSPHPSHTLQIKSIMLKLWQLTHFQAQVCSSCVMLTMALWPQMPQITLRLMLWLSFIANSHIQLDSVKIDFQGVMLYTGWVREQKLARLVSNKISHGHTQSAAKGAKSNFLLRILIALLFLRLSNIYLPHRTWVSFCYFLE